MKKLLFILPLLYYSCTDDIISDIDSILTENAEQDAQIDSLMTVLTQQQAYIDSLNNAQNIADSLDNLAMQSYIDSLINAGNISDDLLQTYIDSLNNVQSNYDTNQQAYIDSLINLGNVSDSLLQVYTDSLNTVQNTYIDSLHNAQQTTLTALANSALSAGFVETEVFNGTLVEDVWTDLDLSSAVGQKNSLVLIKVGLTASIPSNPAAIFFRTNGDTNSYHTPTEGYWSPSGISAVRVGDYGSGTGQNTEMAMAFTDSEGLIEYEATYPVPVYITVVFYLNQ